MEALIEIIGGLFEAIFEWRKERSEEGSSAQETVQLGGRTDGQPDEQQDSSPYSYQLGGRPEQAQGSQQGASVGTSSRRGIRPVT